MFDDLRDSNSPFLEEDQTPPPPKPRRSKKDKAGFLGMTATQRFVLALLLFFMVCACGGFLLILSGKFALPF